MRKRTHKVLCLVQGYTEEAEPGFEPRQCDMRNLPRIARSRAAALKDSFTKLLDFLINFLLYYPQIYVILRCGVTGANVYNVLEPHASRPSTCGGCHAVLSLCRLSSVSEHLQGPDLGLHTWPRADMSLVLR